MQKAYETLLSRKATTPATGKVNTKTGRIHPRIVTLGGDHSIVCPLDHISSVRHFLLYELWDRYTGRYPWYTLIVILIRIHFRYLTDIRWSPRAYPSVWTSSQSDYTHGTMFW